MKLTKRGSGALLAVLLASPVPASAQARGAATPPEMVTAYDALADVILGSRRAERKLVLSLLAASYGQAQSELARARQSLTTRTRRAKPRASTTRATWW